MGKKTCFAKNTWLHHQQEGGLYEPDRNDSRKNVNDFNAATKICHHPFDDHAPDARRMTFRNLSRYSDLHERTYARQFEKSFDFADCSHVTLTTSLPSTTTKIAAMDCTFGEKSGTQTYGLDRFYHGSHDRAEHGLEFSELAVVDVDYGTAYHLSMEQTPDTATLHKALGADKTVSIGISRICGEMGPCSLPGSPIWPLTGIMPNKNLSTASVTLGCIWSVSSAMMPICGTCLSVRTQNVEALAENMMARSIFRIFVA